MRPTIATCAGRSFSFIEPQSSLVSIREIAHALAHICRFTGHTATHYSVAQHSVLVSYAVPDKWAYEGLMHDAAEAFVGDVSAPLKALLPDYKVVEARVERMLHQRFNYGRPEAAAEVKLADKILRLTEKRDLMPADGESWSDSDLEQPLPWTIEPLPPFVARALFLRRFEQLGGVV
ncbi:MAG: hypothetical protein RL375_3389 [Pseudomonadota bacterium]|jgi:5'-deoxynucleotidase YfbR-like HD superfamily hydrolase